MTGGMALEVGLAVLILLVFVVGLSWRGHDKRQLGVLVAIGLAVLLWMAFRVEPGAVLFGGTFVQDELAIFAKRLFLLATILGVLASLSLRAATFARRATEYYVAMLASLLGMLVLASARELILLFVAFELMSIPLYVISGFRKREEESIEAALKFFLIGTVSSAFIVYGLSFVYGISRTTDMAGVAAALVGPRTGDLVPGGLQPPPDAAGPELRRGLGGELLPRDAVSIGPDRAQRTTRDEIGQLAVVADHRAHRVRAVAVVVARGRAPTHGRRIPPVVVVVEVAAPEVAAVLRDERAVGVEDTGVDVADDDVLAAIVVRQPDLRRVDAVDDELGNADALNLRRAGERFSMLPTI